MSDYDVCIELLRERPQGWYRNGTPYHVPEGDLPRLLERCLHYRYWSSYAAVRRALERGEEVPGPITNICPPEHPKP